MAVYKSEFLSHYFKSHLRPRTAHTMGQIHRWARIASLMPGLANFFTAHTPFSNLAKHAAGLHAARTIPRFAAYTFKGWFKKRKPPESAIHNPKSIILWPDTFSNYFQPQIAQATVGVLEAAGFHVDVPTTDLCCGRPLYDWGMLDQAKKLLRKILVTLKQPIENGTPVVALEPSCASVFREELVNLFPNDENAKRLKDQTFLLCDFLTEKAANFDLPKLKKRALLHGHCHHKALWKMDDEEALLKKLGVDYEMPDTGCCGMAGAFGFEKQHYEVSIRCGERVLLPAVRELNEDELIITDGFSCREQILQATGRSPMHIAEVLELALSQREDK
jgi:Fe-S oxidoreductase